MKTLLLISSAPGREALYTQAERDLAPGFSLVRIVDTISLESSSLTVPSAGSAEVVAREPPRLLPGGVTLLVSYVVLPMSGLLATRYQLEGTRVERASTIILIPERAGRALPS